MSEDLQRFVDAQAPVYEEVLAELRSGRKTTHWMWFVFPQLRGLGTSPMAHRFGLSDLQEAKAYIAHPVLGPRLEQCVQALLQHPQRSAQEILGAVDALKLRSCLTLFTRAAPDRPALRQALQRLYAAQEDPATLKMLQQ